MRTAILDVDARVLTETVRQLDLLGLLIEMILPSGRRDDLLVFVTGDALPPECEKHRLIVRLLILVNEGRHGARDFSAEAPTLVSNSTPGDARREIDAARLQCAIIAGAYA
jgi:hypothetical protein